MSNLGDVTDQEFQKAVLDSDTPVLVDFWAEWCVPCHMVSPVVEEIGQDKGTTLKVVKLNIDENPATAARFASGMNCGKPPVGMKASSLGFFAMVSVNCCTDTGKSSLVNEILYRALARKLYRSVETPGKHKEILGMELIDKVIEIDHINTTFLQIPGQREISS